MTDQTDSPKLRPRPFSQPIDEKALSSIVSGGLRPELVDIWSQRCAFVVDEILQTEGDYVNALDDIIQGYRIPLVTRLKSSSDTQKLINNLFGNIEELHGLHMSLLRKLRAHDTEPHEFGQVFIQTEDGFKLYTAYCTNYNSSMLCLQQLLMSEKHNQFLDQCQRNLKHSLPLSAQLIKPVQRIMRYHLLLHELVKHFNPNHYGYPNLKQAHKTMARIADHINKVKKKEENERRVKHLQTSLYGWKGNDAQDNLSVYGELILESTCHVGTKKGTVRQVLLFEKLLLILKKKDAKRYNYKAHIVASELCLDDTQSSTNRTSFRIFCKTRHHITYTIDPHSNSKRTEWVKAINELTRRMAQQYSEEEYGQFIKRKKLDEVVLSNQSSPMPQRRGDSPLIMLEHSSPDLHGRIPSQRKRRRGDVRELFGQNEGVQLVNVRRVHTDETTYQVPAQSEQLEGPVPTSEPASEENMDQMQSGVSAGRRAESMESLLSLSDVEFGMEEHAGDMDEIDYHRKKIKRRPTDLKRRQAIKVKRSPSNRSLNASISTRIRRKAREAKEDIQGEHSPHTDRRESISDEETELAKLMAPPTGPSHLLDSSMDQDSLYDSSMDSSSLGQSMGGGGREGERDSGALVPHDVQVQKSPEKQVTSELQDQGMSLDQVPVAMGAGATDSVSDSGVQLSLRKISTGPPIQIIPDYRERQLGGGTESTDTPNMELEEDKAFATLMEDAGIGETALPQAIITDSEGEQDFVIVEDSSTDSEDEEEEDEGVSFNFLSEFDEGSSVDVIPPPPSFAGDQEVPSGEPDIQQQQQAWDSTEVEKSFQTKEELSDFFKTLSRGATPDPESADISTSTDLQPPSQPSTTELEPRIPQEMQPYHFKGNTDDLVPVASPAALERVREAEIYATMPRNKPHSKANSPAQNSPSVMPVSGQQLPGQYSPKKQLMPPIIGAHTPRSAAARRAEGFSELLQFTRQQQSGPLGDMDVSQSLPSFASGQLSLDDRGIPLDDEELGDDIGESKSGSITVSKSSILPQPSNDIFDNAHLSQHDPSKVSTVPQLQAVQENSELEETNEKTEFAISPPLGDSDHEKEDTTMSRGVVANEKSETIESNGTLSDANPETELAVSPPYLGDAEKEKEPSKSTDITPDSLVERSEGDEEVMEISKSDEDNERQEFISPPLADSDDEMEERKEPIEPQVITADSDYFKEKSEEAKTKSNNEGELYGSDSGQNRENTPQIAVNGHEEMSDKTEANELQQNGHHHLRHRTGQYSPEMTQDQPKPEISDSTTSKPVLATSKEPSDSTTTSVLDSSREERESSVDSSLSESHSELVQQPSPLRRAQATGMLGWLHGFSRNVLFGLLPQSVGLRRGLVVVGVAAISYLLLYNLTATTSTASGR